MLPNVLERKLTLADAEHHYVCELLAYRQGFGILRYVIDRDYDVAGFKLAPGDVTLALYWEGRPYTLYVWFRKEQRDRAFYFNIADSVLLKPQEFSWRDLAVDILVDGFGSVQVLDEHELPRDLPHDLARYIAAARDHILAHFRDIIREAEGLLGTEEDKARF